MWKTLNYETQGRGHVKSNRVCQDQTFSLEANGVVVVALADGAGSAKKSDQGAYVACHSICNYITDHFDELVKNEDAYTVKKEILDYVLTNLNKKAKEIKCDLFDLSSTLLCAAVKNDQIMVFHIGDGVIGYVKNNRLLALSKPNNGEFANSTYFVTSKHASEQARVYRGSKKGISGFILLSDGAAESFYDKKIEQLSMGARRIIDWTQFIFTNRMFPLIKEIFDTVIVNNTTDDCSIAIIADNVITKEDFQSRDKKEKCQLFDRGVSIQMRYLAERFSILKFVSEPKSLNEIASFTKLENSQISYRLRHLTKLGMIEGKDRLYGSDII